MSSSSLRQLLTTFLVSSLISDRGNLVFSSHNPSSEAAYLTGPGLDSKNNALCNDDDAMDLNVNSKCVGSCSIQGEAWRK